MTSNPSAWGQNTNTVYTQSSVNAGKMQASASKWSKITSATWFASNFILYSSFKVHHCSQILYRKKIHCDSRSHILFISVTQWTHWDVVVEIVSDCVIELAKVSQTDASYVNEQLTFNESWVWLWHTLVQSIITLVGVEHHSLAHFFG